MANQAILKEIMKGGDQPDVLNNFIDLQKAKANQLVLKKTAADLEKEKANAINEQKFNNAAAQFMADRPQLGNAALPMLGDSAGERQQASLIMMRADPARFLEMREQIANLDEKDLERSSAINQRLAGVIAGLAQHPNKLQAYGEIKQKVEPLVGQLPDIQDEATLDQFLRAKAIELGASTELMSAAFPKPVNLSQGSQLRDPISGELKAENPRGPSFGQPQVGADASGNPIYFQTDDGGNVKRVEGVTPQQASKPADVSGLRKEFTSVSKPFIEVRDAYQRVASAKPNAAGDRALVFAFMKMLDPGSVVREGEFATAQNAAGVTDRVRNTYNSLLRGEILTADQRDQFRDQAKSIYGSQRDSYRDIRGQYRGIAERQGVAPEDVLIDFEAGFSEPEPAGPPTRDVIELDGKRYRRLGPNQFEEVANER